jgi:hypothetical protein
MAVWSNNSVWRARERWEFFAYDDGMQFRDGDSDRPNVITGAIPCFTTLRSSGGRLLQQI